MRKALRIVFVLIFCFVGLSSLFAATDTANHDVTINIIEVVLIDVNAGLVTLTTVAPGTGGAPVTGESDTSKWLQYTSLVAFGETRTITAELDASPTVTGILLQLVSAAPAGGAEEGTEQAAITLTVVAQVIINAITSCATGTGGAEGANLTYTLIIDNVALLLVGQSDTVNVTFTLTDAV